MRSRSVISGVVSLLAALVLFFAQAWQHEKSVQLQRLQTSAKLSEIRAKLEGAINTTAGLLRAIEAYVVAARDISPEEFDTIASSLMRERGIIRNVGLAKNNIVTFVYPKEGNEAIIGVDLASHPLQKASVLQTIETKKCTVAGPVDLVQGGRAFIIRIPIFLRPNKQNNRFLYWGFVSAPISMDGLFEEAGLKDPKLDISIAIRGKDGLGEKGEQFYGSPKVFSDNPTLQEVSFPSGYWQIAGIPKAGWIPAVVLKTLLISFAGWLVTFVSVFFMLRKRDERAQLGMLLAAERSAHLQTDAQLRFSDHRFRYMLETMPVMISAFDSEGCLVLWNHECERVLGFSAAEMLHNKWAMGKLLGDDDYRARMFTQYQKMGRDYRNLEWEFTTKDGSKKIISLSAMGASCPIPEYPGGWGIGVDITEQKSAQESLRVINETLEEKVDEQSALRRESEALFQAVYENYALGLAMIDFDRRIIQANPAFHSMLGFENGELSGMHEDGFLCHDPDNSVGSGFGTELERLLAGQIKYYTSKKNYKTKDSKIVALNLTVSLIWDKLNEPKCFFVIAEDVTQQLTASERAKKHEQILIQQSKMAAMGEMIASIAHQWRQPLNAIGLIVQDIYEAHKYTQLDETYMKRSVEKSMNLISYMSQTIEDFRNFFKPDKTKEEFNLKDAVHSTMSLVSSGLKDFGIKAVVDCPEFLEEEVVNGYRNEFKQVLLNLISNAKDALQGSSAEQPCITVEIKKEDNRLCIEVSDNAGGIPEQVINHIFEPYFTTKDCGDGTGIGLYMSKLIVEENMGGKLTAKNGMDGAVFKVEF